MVYDTFSKPHADEIVQSDIYKIDLEFPKLIIHLI